MINEVKGVAMLCALLAARALTGCFADDDDPAEGVASTAKVSYQEQIVVTNKDGVDLLVVVDNGETMGAVQPLLSTAIYSLINHLTRPTEVGWDYPAVDDVRVAVISSDMGLMWGDAHSTAGSPTEVAGCDAPSGDNGAFRTVGSTATSTIHLKENSIDCDETGVHCPPNWRCSDIDEETGLGTCTSPDGTAEVSCATLDASSDIADGTGVGDLVPLQAACTAHGGTDGCAVQQPLEAVKVSLEREGEGFLKWSHLLAVLVVTDKDDCSIADADIFNDPVWSRSGGPSVACGEGGNNGLLFDTERYYDILGSIKESAYNVLFGVVAGVPPGATCEGNGEEIRQCLDDSAMALVPQTTPDAEGTEILGVSPACTRTEPDDTQVAAAPARRLVSVAQRFGDTGYVSSVCNADWNRPMARFASGIAEILAKQGCINACLNRSLDWQPVGDDASPPECDGEQCGKVDCDVVVAVSRSLDEPEDCPEEIYDSLPSSERDAWASKRQVIVLRDDAGDAIGNEIVCPLPELPSPKPCDRARAVWASDASMGWYYCENSDENTFAACQDGMDNDGDGKVDADDADCAPCLGIGSEGHCMIGCRHSIETTDALKQAVARYRVKVMCFDAATVSDATTSLLSRSDEKADGPEEQ